MYATTACEPTPLCPQVQVNVAVFPLPGGGRLCVHLQLDLEYRSGSHVLVVAAEGLGADALCGARLQWQTRDARGAPGGCGAMGGSVWQRGNGCLAEFPQPTTLRIWGSVTVYGSPAAALPEVSRLACLALFVGS